MQSDGGVSLDEVEVDLVAEEFSDVVDTVSVQVSDANVRGYKLGLT